tara:strand:- start:491 stop:628 length:138 start_codon:yes stop_codon:yes gene_type:complete
MPLHLVGGDPTSLKKQFKCDLVIKNQTHFFVLDEILEGIFEEIKS